MERARRKSKKLDRESQEKNNIMETRKEGMAQQGMEKEKVEIEEGAENDESTKERKRRICQKKEKVERMDKYKECDK